MERTEQGRLEHLGRQELGTVRLLRLTLAFAAASLAATPLAAAASAAAGPARAEQSARPPLAIGVVDSGIGAADRKGHGSAVAAVLREAIGDAARARLVSYPDLNRAGAAQPRLMAAAIRRAVGDGVRLVNISQTIRGAAPRVRRAIAAAPRTLFVAAAGNEGLDLDALGLERDPCTVPSPNLICVAATDPGGDRLAPFSNRGRFAIDAAAPGAGTSFAAPRVSAAAARLIWAHPRWGIARIRDAAIARFPVPPG